MFGIPLDYLLVQAILTTGVTGLGLFIGPVHTSTPRGRFIGWLTLSMCVGGVTAAGLLMFGFGWPPGKEWLGASFAGGGFGFLCGVSVGRFVWKYYRKEIEGEADEPG